MFKGDVSFFFDFRVLALDKSPRCTGRARHPQPRQRAILTWLGAVRILAHCHGLARTDRGRDV